MQVIFNKRLEIVREKQIGTHGEDRCVWVLFVSCMKLRSGRKMVDPRNPNPNGEPPPEGNTNAAASVGSSSVVVSSTSPKVVTTTQPVTARPTMVTTSRKYVPSFARNTLKYRMPTAMMAWLHNCSPIFGENSALVFSPYHASWSLGKNLVVRLDWDFPTKSYPLSPQVSLLSWVSY